MKTQLVVLAMAMSLAVLTVGGVALAAGQSQQQSGSTTAGANGTSKSAASKKQEIAKIEKRGQADAKTTVKKFKKEGPSKVNRIVKAPMHRAASYADIAKRKSATKSSSAQTAGNTVQPFDEITGDCGYSFFYIYDIGGGTADFRIGFTLDQPATEWSYYIGYYNFSAFSGDTLSGGYSFDPVGSVAVDDKYPDTGGGYVAAGAEIFAYMEDGSYCYSGPLSDSADISE